MSKKYYLDVSHNYNHGCADSAVYEDNGNGTATCIEAHSCNSCWEVGHDDNHIYAEIGEIVSVDSLLDLHCEVGC
jgi:hypothetical protein